MARVIDYRFGHRPVGQTTVQSYSGVLTSLACSETQHVFRPSLALVVCLALPPDLPAENWPEFRGPTGQGTIAKGSLPTEWSADKNVVWKQRVPGLGWSSPIIWEGRIYLTTSVPITDTPRDDQSL